MIASRRAASPTDPSTKVPSESGPRWTSVALIAASRPGSTVSRAIAIPQIPHMRHYSSDAVSGFGAHEELQLLALLISAAALLLLADPLRIPYPILLVLGGLMLGFAPGVPNVVLPPEVVLIGILPPLLYSAAFNTGLRELRRNLRPISFLALGLVAADDGHGRRRRALRDRSLVAGRVRARSNRLADRSARRDVDRPAARRPTARDRDHRRREPGQRRHGARPLQVRGRSGAHRLVLAPACGREPFLVGSRRHRRRARDRPRDPIRAPARLQPAARGDDRVSHWLLRVPAGSGARCVRRARGRHGRRLHGLAYAGADDGRDSAPGRRFLGDLQLPVERAALRPRRPPAAADPRPAARLLVGGAHRLCGARLGRRVSDSNRLRLPDHLHPAVGVAESSRARSRSALAVRRVHLLGGDEGSGHARRGACDSAEHGFRRAVLRPLADRLPRVLRRAGDARPAGAHAPRGRPRAGARGG